MDFMDVFFGSKELRRTIVELSVKHRIPLKYICNEIGTDYNIFMQAYINGSSKFSITEYQVRRMLTILGIEVRTQFVLNSKHDYALIKQRLKEKHGYDDTADKPYKETTGPRPFVERGHTDVG